MRERIRSIAEKCSLLRRSGSLFSGVRGRGILRSPLSRTSIVLTHRAGYPTQDHGRVLLGLEKPPRPPDAWESSARDATQRSARPRRPARLLLPAVLLPFSHRPRFPDGPGDRQPRSRPEKPVRGLYEARACERPYPRGRLRRSHASHREHRRARPRYPGRPVAGPGRLYLHHQGGEPLLSPRGEPAVLAVARRLPAHNLGFYATHRGPDPRGFQRRSLPLVYSRSARKRRGAREAPELGHGLRSHHPG